MKNRKSNFGFLYTQNMANFEAFQWNFSSSTNPEFGRSVVLFWLELALSLICGFFFFFFRENVLIFPFFFKSSMSTSLLYCNWKIKPKKYIKIHRFFVKMYKFYLASMWTIFRNKMFMLDEMT